VQYSVQETIEKIERWLNDYREGKVTEYIIYDIYTGKEIKEMVKKGKTVTVGFPKTEYTYGKNFKLEDDTIVTGYSSTDKFNEEKINSNNMNKLIDTENYYIKSIQEESEIKKY
jgi:hypothetical protein